jgi:plastocyanin
MMASPRSAKRDVVIALSFALPTRQPDKITKGDHPMRKALSEMNSMFGLAGVLVLMVAGSADAAKYKVVPVKNGGTIKGTVLIGKAKPQSQTFKISKDPTICGSGARTVHFVRANGKALLDAVVYLYKIKGGKPFPKMAKQITINQNKCSFAPPFTIVANGGNIKVINSDATLHNIHTYELIGRARRTVFNVSQPKKGSEFTKTVKLRRGAGMKIECDAHDFMHGFVFVARNPYFARVGKDGTFTITNVPPGSYKIRVWHGVLGIKKGKVEVKPDGTAKVDFSY